jgi:hypothetical protein
MSRLVDSSISIYEALENIKNGKYVMPAFQRQYVWSMEQVEKLWDSILLDYPIATFLFWHVDDDNVTWDTYFCNFLNNVTFDNRKQADTVNYELSNRQLFKILICTFSDNFLCFANGQWCIFLVEVFDVHNFYHSQMIIFSSRNHN